LPLKKVEKGFKQTLRSIEGIIKHPDQFAKGLASDPLFWVSTAAWFVGVPLPGANLTWGAFKYGGGLGGFSFNTNWLQLGTDTFSFLSGQGFNLGLPSFNLSTPLASAQWSPFASPVNYEFAGQSSGNGPREPNTFIPPDDAMPISSATSGGYFRDPFVVNSMLWTTTPHMLGAYIYDPSLLPAGDRWFNNGWTDWINPYAYAGSLGDSLGTRIGEGWVAGKDFANLDFDEYTAQQSRMYNDISTPGSNLTPADIAGQRNRDLGGALTRIGNDVYRVGDGIVASGELAYTVVGTVEGGFVVRDLATGVTRFLSRSAVREAPSLGNIADDLVSSAGRPSRSGSDISRGVQALQKRIDNGSSLFGNSKTQQAAERTIREIVKDAVSVSAKGNRVEFYDNIGRGVRMTDGEFDTYLNPYSSR
jgi:hypothetical protein